MLEINPTDSKSIKTLLFLEEGFHEAVRESVESERDNERVEAKLSRDDELNKCHYRVYHVWCLDPVNTKDFFEIIRTIRLHSGTAA